ncbi:hypothetical protein [Aquimarina sp. 2201CG14-23]|uniref:hypothetical protein n=1 Tax=Aquimarina mycalae TaxID=3040073 RepID=UPI002477D9BF|nr:hypothetical protein [Aquimarina sp. 2201CG14-23]MDH7447789.1 hypothetical protein [Aquimarina sp. 2201CG14-23]
MNKNIITLCIGMLLLTSVSAVAQKKTLAKSHHQISGTTQEITDELTSMLGLSKQQQSAIYQVFEKRKNNAKSENSKAISKKGTLDDQMKKILRPEQYKIYYKETRQGRT